jgi:hypothetical protein
MKPARGDSVAFDALAMLSAMDRKRTDRALTWRQVADEIWALSPVLNPRRPTDHPISPSTITGIAKRGDTTCQHALFFLRWLDRTPESFLVPPPGDADAMRLPDAGPDRRLRWNLATLYEALNARRQERGLTWNQLARELRCTPSQLTGIRTARYAIGMRLAMAIVVWLEVPAARFVYAANW